MALKNLAHITHKFWDFDGVKYDYKNESIPRFKTFDLLGHANAKGVCSIFPDLDYDEAKKMGEDGYVQYGDCAEIFVPLGVKRGLSPDETRLKVFQAFHQNMLEMFPRDCPELFEIQPELIASFEKSKDRLTHVVVTHSCVDIWAQPMAKRMGFHEYIDYWFGYDTTGFKLKSKGPEALEEAVERTKALPEESSFTEDSLTNLEVAKNRFPDMAMVFKGELKEDQKKPDYVDFVISKPHQSIDLVLNA